jgi:polyferredoxin
MQVCPQTVFTFMFIWIEEKTEGSKNKRIHLDKQPLGMMKILRKFSKHSLWLITTFFTALTFVGYFDLINNLFTQFFLRTWFLAALLCHLSHAVHI